MANFFIKLHIQEVQTDNPLHMILLHGFGSNEDDLLGLAEFFPKVRQFSSIRSPIEIGRGSYAWYPLQIDSQGNLSARLEDTVQARIMAHEAISAAKKQVHFCNDRTLLLGFSQGAIMSLQYGLNFLRSVGGVIALSGRQPEVVPDELLPKNTKTKFFLGHGTNDSVLPVSGSEDAARYLKDSGIPVEFHTYPIAHSISLEEIEDINRWIEANFFTPSA